MFSCKAQIHPRTYLPYSNEPPKTKCRCKKHPDVFREIRRDNVKRFSHSAPATPKKVCRCEPLERYEVKPVQICIPNPPPSPEVARYSLAKWYNKKPLLQVTPKEQIKRLEKYCEIKNLVYTFRKEHERQLEIEHYQRYREDPCNYSIQDDRFLQDYVFRNAPDDFCCSPNTFCADQYSFGPCHTCHQDKCGNLNSFHATYRNDESKVTAGIQKIVIRDPNRCKENKHCETLNCTSFFACNMNEKNYQQQLYNKRNDFDQQMCTGGTCHLEQIPRDDYFNVCHDNYDHSQLDSPLKNSRRNQGTNTCDFANTSSAKIKVDVNLNCLS